VEALLYATKYQALLLISTTDVRVVSVACTMNTCGAGSSLTTKTLLVGCGSGAQTGVPFVFASSLKAFQSLYAGSARWIDESCTLLLTVRYADGSVGIVAAVLDYSVVSQQASVISLRRVGGALSGITGVATLPGAMSWPNITGLASPPAIDLFRTGGALTVRGRGFAQPFLQLQGLTCTLQALTSTGQAVGSAVQFQAYYATTLSNGDAQALCVVPFNSEFKAISDGGSSSSTGVCLPGRATPPACAPCPVGSYKAASSGAACTKCRFGYTTTTTGSTAVSDCKEEAPCDLALVNGDEQGSLGGVASGGANIPVRLQMRKLVSLEV